MPAQPSIATFAAEDTNRHAPVSRVSTASRPRPPWIIEPISASGNRSLAPAARRLTLAARFSSQA